ncbi:MAG: transposase [Pseudomonadota bacterium]
MVQHIVFGLEDAFRTARPDLTDPIARALWADKELDAGRGSRLLAKAQNATIVEDCLFYNDGERYALAAWCIMPTHVHIVAELFEAAALGALVQQWKSFTAHAINKAEARKGALWQREYFDRFMRSEQQLEWTLRYVENNPVAAGLAQQPEDWRFSSARRKRSAGEDAGAPY